MYDTVNFWFDSGDMAGGDTFAVLPCLCDVVEQQSDKKGYSCSGKCGDYTVFCSPMGVSLQGSLANYYLPSNVSTLTRSTAKEALEKMSDALHLDMMKARVTRLDVSTVIPTKRPPTDYFPSLGEKPHYKRLQTHAETLYYNQNNRQLIFYDKSKWAEAKGAVVPPTLNDCNLLRYEIRLLHHVSRLLKLPTVTGATLVDGVFYYNIIQLWKREFQSINKINTISVMTDSIKNPREAKEALLAMLLQHDGQNVIDGFIADLKACNVFSDRKYYTRLKSDLNKIMQGNRFSKNELVEELEKAISDVAKYAR